MPRRAGPMMRRRLLTYLRSQHAGLLAMMIALGGTSYAAATLPRSSVGAVQLKRNAVTSAKVKDGTLLAKDFRAGALAGGATGDTGSKGEAGVRGEPGAKGGSGPTGDVGAKGEPGARGDVGAKGDPGAKGDRGAAGPPGLSGHEVVVLGGLVQPADTTGSFNVSCPAGKNVLGGGVAVFLDNIRVVTSTPLDDGTSWLVRVRPFAGTTFGGSGPSAVNVRIVCAAVSPP